MTDIQIDKFSLVTNSRIEDLRIAARIVNASTCDTVKLRLVCGSVW